MTERTNHTVVEGPADAMEILTKDRDEWKRRALAAEAEVKQLEQRLSDEYWRGRDDERRGGYEF